jgi:hypothetical protein
MPERALIALLIVDRPLCLDCISVRAAVPQREVIEYLHRLRDHLTVFHEDSGRCEACGTVGKVYSLDRLLI